MAVRCLELRLLLQLHARHRAPLQAVRQLAVPVHGTPLLPRSLQRESVRAQAVDQAPAAHQPPPQLRRKSTHALPVPPPAAAAARVAHHPWAPLYLVSSLWQQLRALREPARAQVVAELEPAREPRLRILPTR